MSETVFVVEFWLGDGPPYESICLRGNESVCVCVPRADLSEAGPDGSVLLH